jgi:hypothetical protein
MIGSLEKRIVAQHRSNEASKRLETILGIGIIGATTIAAVIPDRRVFRSGRDFAAVGRRREKRGLGAAPGVRSSSRWGWQPLRPSHHVLEEKALQQRGRRRIVDSVMSRCALRSNPPFGAPGKPPLAAQQIAVGQRFARQILRVQPDERIFGKRADIGPEYEGALAVAGRQRPRVVRRRQTGILDIGDFHRRNGVDRRPMASRIRANAAATRTSGCGRGWRARRRAGVNRRGVPTPIGTISL